jgi:acyl-CoA hydrolase
MLNDVWSKSFIVYPSNCNYMEFEGKPMIHGGDMLLQMDRVAAECVRRFLYNSPCNNARTVGVNNVSFVRGAKLGDLIVLTAHIISVGIKQVKVLVSAFVEDSTGRYTMSVGEFSFCSFLDDKPHPHGIKL